MSSSIVSPFPVFNDLDGTPLESGYIYIGTANLNPEASPINVFWDAALTVPAAQPIRTVGGYASRNGSPSRMYVSADTYSITVRNRNRVFVYNSAEVGVSAVFLGYPVTRDQLSLPLLGTDSSFVQSGTGAVTRTMQDKAREIVSVKDFGAVGDGTDATEAFNAAAAFATTVRIPKGTYLISAPTNLAVWYLEKGAVIAGLPNKGTAGGGVQDTSRLTGAINSLNSGGINTLKVGDSDPWLTSLRDTIDFLSGFMSVSPFGAIAGSFATRSSDNPEPNMQTIGVAAFGVNDNATNPEPSWCIYTEAIRYPGTGPAFGAEMDFVNLGNTNNLTPYSAIDPYGSTNAPTVNLWLSCGGGDSGLAASANNISAAIALLPNSKKFNAGIVVRDGSIESGDIVRAPSNYSYSWQNSSFVTSTLNDRQHYRAVYSDIQNLSVSDISRKNKSNGISATTSGETIYSSGNEANSGLGTFLGTNVSVVQQTDFSGGSARFAYIISARNSDGGFTEIALNQGGNARFVPVVDNVVSLGHTSNRWSTIYAGTGTINTSDINLKQDIEELSVAEQAVAKELKKLVRKFRFKDAVQEKGDKARIHVGVIAQDVIAAFSNQGLDANKYGILCFDEWDDQLDVLDHEGNVIQKGKQSGSCYGIRYEELLAFIISAI